jgi:hypothetical protein
LVIKPFLFLPLLCPDHGPVVVVLLLLLLLLQIPCALRSNNELVS